MQRKIRIHPDFPIETRWRQKPRRRQRALWKHWQAGAMPTAMGLWVSIWPDGILGVLIFAYSWASVLFEMNEDSKIYMKDVSWRVSKLQNAPAIPLVQCGKGRHHWVHCNMDFPDHPRFLSSVGRSWNSWACWAAAVLALWNWCSTCPDRWLERGS